LGNQRRRDNRSLVVDLGRRQKVGYVLVQEYIRLGQRVKAFSVEVEKDGQWVEVPPEQPLAISGLYVCSGRNTKSPHINFGLKGLPGNFEPGGILIRKYCIVRMLFNRRQSMHWRRFFCFLCLPRQVSLLTS
jgi:hypothetical protein